MSIYWPVSNAMEAKLMVSLLLPLWKESMCSPDMCTSPLRGPFDAFGSLLVRSMVIISVGVGCTILQLQ